SPPTPAASWRTGNWGRSTHATLQIDPTSSTSGPEGVDGVPVGFFVGFPVGLVLGLLVDGFASDPASSASDLRIASATLVRISAKSGLPVWISGGTAEKLDTLSFFDFSARSPNAPRWPPGTWRLT